MMTRIQPRRTHQRGQDGSAYIIALLVLVVLTIIGLGLALITQTEMEIGANEKTLQRVFYAADSGISRSISQAVNSFDGQPIDFTIDDPDSPLLLNLREEVAVTPFVPIFETFCDLCSVEGIGSSMTGEQGYAEIHHAVTSVATRQGPAAASAERTIGTIVGLLPWPEIEDMMNVDPTEVAKVKM
jgi:hypothetical protein